MKMKGFRDYRKMCHQEGFDLLRIEMGAQALAIDV